MKLAGLFLSTILFLGLLAAPPITAEDAQPNPQEKLETTIEEAIRLLEKEEYIDLLKTFVSPEDFKKLTKDKPVEELAKGFGMKKAERLLKVLKHIKDTEPELKDEGNLAIYKVSKEFGSKSTISFVRIDKLWYIKN